MKNNIRNFAIVAHIDHGKSTLADRLLEITGTVQSGKHADQMLDQNPISRERGITIKLAPVRMSYTHNSQNYILNLIDTPGHIDFSYEVSRTLACCEGVVLLVDATSGIQAQTVAHYNTAIKLGLKIVPVINKVDLESARVEETLKDMEELFGLDKSEVILISAKTGQNIKEVLTAVIEKIPSPVGLVDSPMRALIFDAVYDDYRGVIAFVKVVDGKAVRGQQIEFFQATKKGEVGEVGFFSPYLVKSEELLSGDIGYIVTGVKDIRQVRVGDTIFDSKSKIADPNIKPLPGYDIPKPMVFFGMYPKATSDFPLLREALNKLSLNDASLSIEGEHSNFLGSGFRVGFLGLLHAEIVKQRLAEEEGIDPLLTRPSVLYKNENGQVLEPFMALNVYTRKEYVGGIMRVCEGSKGNLIDISYHKDAAILKYEMPYTMFIRGLMSDLKSASSGFASIDYELTDYREASLENLEIFVNDNPIDVLSELVYKDEIYKKGREKTDKLKDLLTREQFRQVIQAKVGGTIIARSEISPFRKDVLAKMSGGDRTRKDKLLKKQKKGKAKMFTEGRVNIPQEALFSLVKD